MIGTAFQQRFAHFRNSSQEYIGGEIWGVGFVVSNVWVVNGLKRKWAREDFTLRRDPKTIEMQPPAQGTPRLVQEADESLELEK